MSYGVIHNPSKTDTMIATLRTMEGHEKVHSIAPRELLPVVGQVIWPLWTLEWKRPRKGLMKFRR